MGRFRTLIGLYIDDFVYYIRLTVDNGLTQATSISWFDIKKSL